MSKVYSFRLDLENPRESQARDVINAWVSQGYSLRQILTNALIMYGKQDGFDVDWKGIYDQLSDLVKGLDEGQKELQSANNQIPLSPNFISAMRGSVKRGIDSKQSKN